MSAEGHILVLGAYGLAGRAIIERLLEKTGYAVVAAGRRLERLHEVIDTRDSGRGGKLVLDAADTSALRDACAGAAFVINAIGPYSRNGAAIARTVIECGTSQYGRNTTCRISSVKTGVRLLGNDWPTITSMPTISASRSTRV